MLRSLSGAAKSAIFTVIALLLATGLALSPFVNTQLYMMTPGVAALLMMLVVTGEGYTLEGWKSLGLHRLGLKAWPFALLAPFAINAIGMGLLFLTGLATYTGLDPAIAAELGNRPIIVMIVTNLVMVTLTTSLGEELGWRGYLLPRLRTLGEGKALLLSGVIWAVWHLPLMLLTTQYHAGQNMLLYFPLFLLSALALGTAIGYTRLRTESVWPASIMHTAANFAWGFYALYYTPTSGSAEFISGDAGLVQLLLYGAIGLWIASKLTKR